MKKPLCGAFLYPGCGRIVYHPAGSNRCPAHPKPKARTRRYFKAAKQVRDNAVICHICKKPFDDPNDPPVADHVLPRAYGGGDEITNLAPAHRSCNGRKGAGLPSYV